MEESVGGGLHAGRIVAMEGKKYIHVRVEGGAEGLDEVLRNRSDSRENAGLPGGGRGGRGGAEPPGGLAG